MPAERLRHLLKEYPVKTFETGAPFARDTEKLEGVYASVNPAKGFVTTNIIHSNVLNEYFWKIPVDPGRATEAVGAPLPSLPSECRRARAAPEAPRDTGVRQEAVGRHAPPLIRHGSRRRPSTCCRLTTASTGMSPWCSADGLGRFS